MTDLSKIRNFSIIAHIDHGKSTLADRLIQFTGGLTDREMSEQVLDNMDIEKERGITIKAQTVRLNYTARDGETYELNLMDTPGHVDFAYEVSRSLAACEGALLVVDAAQGVEAQTLANVYQSIEHDHEIVPVINKIDLPAAEPQRVAEEIEEIVGIEATGPWEEGGAVLTSAKSGIGIEETLEALVKRIPPPTGDRDAPLKAMLVDSWYDPYLGVVILVRVMDGVIKKGQQVRFMQGGTQHLIDRVGCFTPKRTDLPELGPGEIGFITAQIKEVEQARVGDTITTVKNGAPEALKGYKEVQPVVFCGLFPVDAADFEKLRESIGKLRLNDASFDYEMETSAASAPASSACCTWKSSRNASAANTTSTSSPRPRRSCTGSTSAIRRTRTPRPSRSTIPPTGRTSTGSRRWKNRGSRRSSTRPTNISARS